MTFFWSVLLCSLKTAASSPHVQEFTTAQTTYFTTRTID